MHRLLLLVALVACGSRAAMPPRELIADGDSDGDDDDDDGATRPDRPAGQIDVWLGDMGSNTSAGDGLGPVLRDAIAEAFGTDPQFALENRGATGFLIDGVLTVSVARTGRATRIKCKVDILVASYPSKAIFGLPSSSAEVGATTVAADIEAARGACIRAVASELVARHVIPMLRTRSVEQRDMLTP